MTAFELITFKGFLDCFWREYRSGKYSSQEKVYDALDEVYYAEFGEHRFKSFSAFRYRRDKDR